MRKSSGILIAQFIFVLLIAACTPVGDNLQPAPMETSTQTSPSATQTASSQIPAQPLATPVSQQPAAGICARAEGDIVVITINPDVPDPRCVIIAPDQILKVVNNREEDIQVSLGVFNASIPKGEDSVAELPFGDYLAPGVHVIEVSPCCGASLWLQVDN